MAKLVWGRDGNARVDNSGCRTHRALVAVVRISCFSSVPEL